jgi:hypothetical protein
VGDSTQTELEDYLIDLSEIEKGKMCYDLMKKYPEKYSSLRSLAQALGFSDRRIAQWVELYQTSCEAASHLKERIAKFEPKKKEKKTIASKIIYVPRAESSPINIIEIHL